MRLFPTATQPRTEPLQRTAYCKRAKAILADASPSKAAYVLELDLMGEEGSAIQAYLLEKTGQRSVPNARLPPRLSGITVRTRS